MTSSPALLQSSPSLYLGKRLSYDGALCTVRYIGLVEGTPKNVQWLGVEWDDPSRGKHSGEYQGKRYFHCVSNCPTSASFVRPTRPSEQPRSFHEALQTKYGFEGNLKQIPIVFSGKVVEEVGVDKVARQLAKFQELRHVFLDGLLVQHVDTAPGFQKELADQISIQTVCPNIMELDLSRNLVESWQTIADVCSSLSKLKILKLNGNRFRTVELKADQGAARPFQNIEELHLEECLLSWENVRLLLGSTSFPSLRYLSLAKNGLHKITSPLKYPLPALKELVLNSNNFNDLSASQKLGRSLPSLTAISYQANKIDKVFSPIEDVSGLQQTFPVIENLNIARNKITEWVFLDDLSKAYPVLQSLRISGNPLFDEERDLPPSLTPSSATNKRSDIIERAKAETQFILTLARIESLKMLNYSTITTQDRLNGELYYLAQIENEMRAGEKREVLKKHRRYSELCAKHGRDPKADLENKKVTQELIPGSLASRLLSIHLYRQLHPHLEAAKISSHTVPRTIDVYRLKGLVSRELHLPPLSFRLIYESEAMLEQVGIDELDESEDDSDSFNDVQGKSTALSASAKGSIWKRHEIELVSSTQDLSFFVDNDAHDIRIRIEAS